MKQLQPTFLVKRECSQQNTFPSYSSSIIFVESRKQHVRVQLEIGIAFSVLYLPVKRQ